MLGYPARPTLLELARGTGRCPDREETGKCSPGLRNETPFKSLWPETQRQMSRS